MCQDWLPWSNRRTRTRATRSPWQLRASTSRYRPRAPILRSPGRRPPAWPPSCISPTTRSTTCGSPSTRRARSRWPGAAARTPSTSPITSTAPSCRSRPRWRPTTAAGRWSATPSPGRSSRRSPTRSSSRTTGPARKPSQPEPWTAATPGTCSSGSPPPATPPSARSWSVSTCRWSSTWPGASATPTIVGELKRHFRDKGWAVRVPRRLQELNLSLTKVVAELSQEIGRSPTVGEIADRMHLSEDEVLEGLDTSNAYAVVSLDAPAGGEDTASVSDHIGIEDGSLETLEYRAALGPIIAELPERERRILYLRFFRGMTQSQIADRLGISQMHVSRLLNRTLAMLRERLLRDDGD